MQRPSKYWEPNAPGERRANPPHRPRLFCSARRVSHVVALSPFIAAVLFVPGCKSAGVNEVRGKTFFGPEFQHSGTKSTDQIRYTEVQGVELRWDNGWTTGVTYRRRDIDGGTGDNENLVSFELGYPIWKAPKKPDKTAMQIEELQKRVGELQSQLARTNSQEASLLRLVEATSTDNGKTNEKENGYAQP